MTVAPSTFVYVAQIDDVRLLSSETSGQETVLIQRTTSFQIERLHPIAREAIHHIDVSFIINQKMSVVLN